MVLTEIQGVLGAYSRTLSLLSPSPVPHLPPEPWDTVSHTELLYVFKGKVPEATLTPGNYE